MAVRHGYGKIAGTDALVFAYDTGDTRNSYRGEPTTNLANTDALRTMTQYADNTVASADAPERGPGWKKLTITARGTNFRTAKFPYITQPTNTARTYSMEIDFNGTSGYYIRGDGFSGFSPNQYTSGIYTSTFTTTTNNGSLALFLNNGTTSVTGINDVIYYRYYQVEDKPHRTPFTEGTRSNTQGLVDLTGNSTIDLANVSFDSNAQVTWDGSNDYISMTGFTQPSNPNNFSVEAVVKLYAHNPGTNIGSVIVNNYSSLNGWIFYLDGPDSRLGLRHHFNGTSGAYSIETGTGINLNQWYHITGTDDGTTVRLYVNGIQVQSGASVTATNYSGQPLIGQFGGSNAVTNGDIPVVKIYNRALTADEVRNNYRHYKTRFNI